MVGEGRVVKHIRHLLLDRLVNLHLLPASGVVKLGSRQELLCSAVTIEDEKTWVLIVLLMWVLPATNILYLKIDHGFSAGFFGLLDLGLLAALALKRRVLRGDGLSNLVTPLRDSCDVLFQLMLVRQCEHGIILTVLALNGRLVKLW